MEFGEKLQSLRKNKGLTQEELAESLYVSRTAVSKWESGRGYPSIDSIKEIASYFSVTVDELLSSEKILSLAEKENKSNIYKICNILFGIVDLLAVLLVILPLYPNTAYEQICSVNLFIFTEMSSFSAAYWILFVLLIISGIVKIILTQLNMGKGQKSVTWCSMGIGILAVIALSLTRQVYSTILIFTFLVMKGVLFTMQVKS